MDSDGTVTPHVVVRPARPSERPLIEGLFQFYAYDWSEMEPPDSATFEVNAEGRFEPYPHLDEYWSANDHWPVLIQADHRMVGFALINAAHSRGGRLSSTLDADVVL